MRVAVDLARRALGVCWPNPAVGALIVKDGVVLGRGWTQPGGRPHAETVALAAAGPAARGGTMYVSLEPCCHHGKTGPCTDEILAAGIARVVAALEDPDPRVSGGGFRRLREAGIETVAGLLSDQAAEVNAGYLLRQSTGRPAVTLKLASTLDGRIATETGESQWITGPAARARAHALRADHDAILVGIGTASRDDPTLTCRLPGLSGQSPVRIVLDSRLHLDPERTLARTAQTVPTWVVTRIGHSSQARLPLERAGVEIIEVPPDQAGRPQIGEALAALGRRGLTRVLVEGGGTIAAALFAADAVDRVVWAHAPSVIGGNGVPAVGGFGVAALADMPRYARVDAGPVGEDVLEIYRRPL